MRRLSPTLLRTLAALTAAVVLAGCSGGGSPSAESTPSESPSASASAAGSGSASGATSAEPTPEPAPVAPTEGACYRLSYDDAVAASTTATPVGCKRRHTSQTFAVGALDAVSAGHLLAVDSDTVRRQAARACPQGLPRFLGATPAQLRLSMLRAVWFTPTLEESDLGASWYRCDVVAVSGDDQIAPLEGDLTEALERSDVRDAYAMCGTAAPDDPAFTRVLCSESHTWRAISVVDLASLGKAYPGVRAVKGVDAAGEDGDCASAARDLADDPLDYEWGYEWPSKAQWKAGQIYGRCWAQD
ncbi:septum formation family protein [Nocardioides flavescens]|uniref:Septum formation-related domain-containing protein n=1 Tax=Nocardioides flavescens TaxID=2691959 RepID=A0A6L7EZB9_9ACTN|nr:septum formation family protein [Nocardioides flavescens]MXG91088.1 hypothetical protein [Nocardioides flavescens]